MKEVILTVVKNRRLTEDVYEAVLAGDTSGITNAGQFINIKLDGVFLRRPISVCDYGTESVLIIYKVVGKGTEIMSKFTGGEKLSVLTGLGNGYDVGLSGDKPLLIGGGVGVPPMYNLAKTLVAGGKRPTVILGFNKKDEVFYEKQFAALGVTVKVTTADGSYGIKGFVTDAMQGIDYTYFYACGPMPMFRAIEKVAKTDGEYSFEERMGCGFGACMGCSCKTLTGNKRICVDGPVMKRGEIIW